MAGVNAPRSMFVNQSTAQRVEQGEVSVAQAVQAEEAATGLRATELRAQTHPSRAYQTEAWQREVKEIQAQQGPGYEIFTKTYGQAVEQAGAAFTALLEATRGDAGNLSSAEQLTKAAQAVLDQMDFPQPNYYETLHRLVDGTATPKDLEDVDYMLGVMIKRDGGAFELKTPPPYPEVPETTLQGDIRRPADAPHAEASQEGLWGRAVATRKKALIADLFAAVQRRLSDQGGLRTKMEQAKDLLS